MKRLFRYASLLALACGSLSASAQRTGSYDTTISFMGGNRAVSVYAPSSYNPATKYRLIVGLHGLGDTCSNYRDALINTLGWGSGFGNTIFVFPEAANRNYDFYLPSGGEAIIPQSVAFAMSQYHIDTQNVVLQGFSLGGRAALRYGLDHVSDFKGLLLTTPAIQGVKEALNGHPQEYPFNYSQGARIPIVLTVGDQDLGYLAPVDSAFEQLVLHDAQVRFGIVPGMGHQMTPLPLLQSAMQFFDNPGHAGADAEAVKVYDAPWICSGSQAAPSLLVRNTGRDTLRSIRFHYSLSGTTLQANWSGTLAPFGHAVVPMPVNNAAPGANLITAIIDSLNSSLADTVMSNNSIVATFQLPGAVVAGIDESFEGADFPPAGWMVQDAGDFWSPWGQDNTIAKTGANSAAAFNTIFFFDNAGRAQGLVTPPVNISGMASPVLTFDVAFLYHHYAPPYALVDTVFADTLEVLASTDCGAHFTSIYRKGGADLATWANPVLNPLDLNSLFLDPADSNWRKETIDLSSLSTAGSPAIFKFKYISALGGAINIDNVFVGSATKVKEPAAAVFNVSPNPARDVVQVSASRGSIEKLELYDLRGKLVAATVAGSGQSSVSLGLHDLPQGMYALHIYSSTGVAVRKLSVLR
jgi:dienelactone hydrolase